MKFRSNFTNRPQVTKEVFTLPSLTQPDMTYKVRDIIKRAENGQYIPVLQGDYDEEGRLEILRKPSFDLTDLDTLNDNIEKVEALKKKLLEVKEEKIEEITEQQEKSEAKEEAEPEA